MIFTNNPSLVVILLSAITVSFARARIVVIGSVNADVFLPVQRLPVEGENLTLLPGKFPSADIPGGKGCTQAIAASKLYAKGVTFVGQFGHDGAFLRDTLTQANVDCSASGCHENLPNG